MDRQSVCDAFRKAAAAEEEDDRDIQSNLFYLVPCGLCGATSAVPEDGLLWNRVADQRAAERSGAAACLSPDSRSLTVRPHSVALSRLTMRRQPALAFATNISLPLRAFCLRAPLRFRVFVQRENATDVLLNQDFRDPECLCLTV